MGKCRKCRADLPPRAKFCPTCGAKHWLSGVVRCASCGTTLIYQRAHGYSYFLCNNYVKGRCQHAQRVLPDALEDAILARLEEDAASGLSLSFQVSAVSSPSMQQITALQASLRSLQAKKSRLQDAYLAGVIDLEDFSTARESIVRDMDSTRYQIKKLTVQTDPTAMNAAIRSHIKEALSTFHSPSSTLETKNAAFRSLVERCTYDKEANLLTITYRASI